MKSLTNRVLRGLGISIVVAGIALGFHQTVYADAANPVIGELLFEENFDSFNPNRWNRIEGNGCQYGPQLCGWGNQELQFYGLDNLGIEEVLGEPNTKMLAIEARRQAREGSAFTSGKITSENKVSIQYGMIETRIRVPDLATGLWPAFWMLGTSTASWPRKGEIDIMEMGHRQAAINEFHPGTSVNNFVGSNAIFWAQEACVPGNESCAAMTSWQTDNAYVSIAPMKNRFVTYRLYWTDEYLRFTAIDRGVEYDMYDSPIPNNRPDGVFNQPFYLLMNLAVGGNFTDAATPAQVTAPLSAKMYVDYVRVYKLDGQGQVILGNIAQPETGTFGVFTDNTPVTRKLEAGVSSDIYVWNQQSIAAGNLAPVEGNNVIAWRYTQPNMWFGGGIDARQALDMSRFGEGHLKFKIKIPANVAFKVGIKDTYTNERWLHFPANQTAYGLVRNGEWAEASIPIAELRGQQIALQSMVGMFYIASDAGSPNTFQMAIDDVRWEGGGAAIGDADGDGVNDDIDQCPATPAGTPVNNVGCPIATPPPTEVRVEAENYHRYFDTTAGNTGGAYRQDDVDIEASAEGGFNVGWTATGEWLEYDVDLNAGTYNISARVASATSVGRYTVLLDGNVIGGNSVATNGWQNWTTQTVNQVQVTSGRHVLRVRFDGPEVNLNWLQFNVATAPLDSDGDGVPDAQDACPGTPAGTPVDASGCALSSGVYGITQTSANSVKFFVNTSSWAIVHYRVNGGDQTNISMSQNNGVNTFTVNGLAPGNTISYNFTYWDTAINGAVDTALQSYVLTGNTPPPDSDNDGVPDDRDLCPNTPPGSVVDSNGCVVNSDSDNDGVPDAQDQCPGTPAGTVVDANGCPVASSTFGINATSANSVRFFVNTSSWAIVHYQINNGTQQNVTMTQSAGGNYWDLNNLAAGTVIKYNFTYWNSSANGAVDTPLATYTVSANPPPPPPPTDTDGDGVPDNLDQCPGTPPGTSVDSNGCPLSGTPVRYEVAAVNNRLVGGADSAKPGFTLYVFDNDQSSSGSNCNGSCATTWPPVLVTDAGATGVAGLSTVTRNDGSRQAAHNGRPLYFYAGDNAVGQTNGQGLGGVWWLVSYGNLGNIVPLYDSSTSLESAITFDRGDALVTRISDRARDRHAKENHFQAYDHFLTFYWEDRTASIEIVDYVAKGGNSIRMNVVTQARLDDAQAENRWFYMGTNTLAEYCGNGVMNRIDDTHYFKEMSFNCRENFRPIQIGDKLEFELSQFLDGRVLARGRDNYYGTTYLYIVGQGLVPWDVTDKVKFTAGKTFQRDSIPVPASARLGGDTTLHVQMTAEPDGHFQQMATNLGYANGQPWVLGRRVHHTSFVDGGHDENPVNGVFDGMAGKAGPHYINSRCTGCHERNGRAPVAAVGQALDRWVFKVGNADGAPHPQLGRVLQPRTSGAAQSEGNVSISHWTEQNGLRKPNYQFTGVVPPRFSARIAPQLNGMGLLEAIPEQAIMALADPDDANGDGISGRANRVLDPVTGQTRLGRFGYKAATGSVKHQIAAAFNTDMGVMTSILPQPDCGSSQTDCGNATPELADQHLNNLLKYVSLLGVRPQRDYNKAQVIQGKALFNSSGCAACHTETHQTSEFHPLAELRNQTIHPYTDLLLHDMGPGLADNLGEGEASGSEWRTAPLWGLGLSACVTGGVAGNHGWDDFGLDGHEYCTPHHSYLHDGRARSIDEAIRWHGGEAQNAKTNYEQLSASQRAALIEFLNSL